MTVVPAPGSLSTAIVPPVCVTIPYEVASPSPVPSPGAFVVKNGSNARTRVSSSMPIPVSRTRIRE